MDGDFVIKQKKKEKEKNASTHNFDYALD